MNPMDVRLHTGRTVHRLLYLVTGQLIQHCPLTR